MLLQPTLPGLFVILPRTLPHPTAPQLTPPHPPPLHAAAFLAALVLMFVLTAAFLPALLLVWAAAKIPLTLLGAGLAIG